MAAVLHDLPDDGGDESAQDTSAVDANAQRQVMIERLAALGSSKMREFNQRVADRRSKEKTWIEDLRLYNGIYDPGTLADIKAKGGSKVFLSIGRTKTDAVEAHHGNLLFPTDEDNWEISATPVPEAKKLAGDQTQIHTTADGHPMTAGDLAVAMTHEMDAACDKMRAQISDQFVECDFSGEGRKVIHQGCVLGTGVLRGPTIKNKKHRAWKPIPGSNVFRKETTTDKRPAAEWVDLWDFYPSTGISNIEQTEGVYVRSWLSRQQLKELQFENDYIADQISLILRENPEAPKVTDQTRIDLLAVTGDTEVSLNAFMMVEYIGPVSTSDLIALGFEDLDDDPLVSIKASVFMIDGVPIKGIIDPMEEAMCRDFQVWQFAKDDTSIFGRGVPRLMRTSVLMANALMRMMMDNAGLATGGQLVYRASDITPADGDYRMTPRKTWYYKGEGDVRQAFMFVEVPMNLEWLIPLFNLAIRLADEESALPLIAQGDQAEHVTKTKGGMSMLMDAAGVVLRRSIKNYDDNITVPIVEAFYDWNMMFNKDESLKGDFSVKARGSSAMLERQQQMEWFTQWVAFMNSDPLLKELIDKKGMVEEGTRLLRVNRGRLLISPEAMEAVITKWTSNPPQPPEDPRIAAAKITTASNEKIAGVTAQVAREKMSLEQQLSTTDAQVVLHKIESELGLKRDELTQRLGLAAKDLDQKAQMFNADLAFHTKTGEAVT